MINLFTNIVILIVLIVGSITDLQKREVADWLNFSLIGVGVGFNLVYSIIYWNVNPILESLAGLVIFLLLALMFFYTGQWGGGDSKMLIGLGAMIGLEFTLKKTPFLVNFILYTFLAGAFYGLIWSVVLVIKHFKTFKKNASEIFNKKEFKLIRIVAYVFVIGLFVLGIFSTDKFLKLFSFFFALFILVFFYMAVFVKAVENGCMIRNMKIEELTEGEWIVEDVIVKGKRICGPKELGIEKSQIEELIKLQKKGLIKDVKVKIGIPFVPAFLMGFILTLILGNVENLIKLFF